MNVSGPHALVVPEYPATGVEMQIPLEGLVVAVGVAYDLGPYSSAVDVSVIEQGDNLPDQEILALSGASDDGWFYPTLQNSDTDGTAIAAQYGMGIPVAGYLTLSVASAQPGDVVYITLKAM